MNKYESVVLLDSLISDDERKKTIEKIVECINEKGKLIKLKELGKKRTAYEIKKQKEAYYYDFYFELNKDAVLELERLYRITDEVIKFIVVREEEENG